MAGFTIKGKVDGLGPILARMAGMKQGVRNRALKRGVTKASRKVAKSAKALAPVDTTTAGLTVKGLYRKSLGQKVMVGKRGTVLGIVGPRRGFKAQVGVRKRDGKKSKAGDPIQQDPANIGHLVEFGHAGPHPAPPHPHLRPSWDAESSSVAQTIGEECWAEIVKEAAKG